LGVIVNQPGAEPAYPLAPNWAGVFTEPAVVFAGGPVLHEGYIPLALLRSGVEAPRRFREVAGRLGTIPLSANGPATTSRIERFRLFNGYLGWGPGGLEADLAREVLLPSDKNAEMVFCDDPARLWDRIQASD
jgi:putative transcriptional regulator